MVNAAEPERIAVSLKHSLVTAEFKEIVSISFSIRINTRLGV